MSRQELRDELMTLLVAGHETTASELAWAFERLSRSPAVLARLREEIDAAEGDAYLTATIQETLRRRPVLPNAAPRLVKREIEIGGWTYPPGACLVAHTYLIHHDPEIYPDPYASARSGSSTRPRHLHVDAVRGRPPPVPRGELRDARDEDRRARRAGERRVGRRRERSRAEPPAQHHHQPRRGRLDGPQPAAADAKLRGLSRREDDSVAGRIGGVHPFGVASCLDPGVAKASLGGIQLGRAGQHDREVPQPAGPGRRRGAPSPAQVLTPMWWW